MPRRCSRSPCSRTAPGRCPGAPWHPPVRRHQLRERALVLWIQQGHPDEARPVAVQRRAAPAERPAVAASGPRHDVHPFAQRGEGAVGHLAEHESPDGPGPPKLVRTDTSAVPVAGERPSCSVIRRPSVRPGRQGRRGRVFHADLAALAAGPRPGRRRRKDAVCGEQAVVSAAAAAAITASRRLRGRRCQSSIMAGRSRRRGCPHVDPSRRRVRPGRDAGPAGAPYGRGLDEIRPCSPAG